MGSGSAIKIEWTQSLTVMNDAGRFRWRPTGEVSSADLLRECGKRLTDIELWKKFQERFQGRIFLYVLRATRSRHMQDNVSDTVTDLAQDVYLRLVQNDGRILRSFRGTTEFSVMAFLARISVSVVSDHNRRGTADKRKAQLVSIDEVREELETSQRDVADFDANSLAAILSWIDVERVLQEDPDQRNARRNLLIFKLHYIDGFTAAEIAGFPAFDLTVSGIETILARLRKRIRR
jgi:DNA-directed RNA polymerase specialized sigma24 family protein